MAKYDLTKMENKLEKYLDESRYRHTIGVMYTAGALAMAHGYDVLDAQTAGLLHDCAKCIPNKKKIRLCEQHDIPVTDFEKEHPFLIHAKLGAYIAEKKYNVSDPAILDAIIYHTTGRPGMSLLEKIIYIADYIEPMRDKAPNLPRVRKLAFADIDECMYEILRDSIEYLETKPKDIDQTTIYAYNYYKNLHNRKNEEVRANGE